MVEKQAKIRTESETSTDHTTGMISVNNDHNYNDNNDDNDNVDQADAGDDIITVDNIYKFVEPPKGPDSYTINVESNLNFSG